VEKIFRLRSCSGAVRPDAEASPCLQHGIDQCTGPCVSLVGIDAYRHQVREAVRLLEEPDYHRVVYERFASLRDAAARAGFSDEAISWQRRLGWLEELDSFRRVLEKPWVDRSWLLVLPGAEAGEGVLIPVARGRVLERRRVSWEAPGWPSAVEDACYSVRVRELRAEAVFQPAELTPSLIVSAWLESGAPEGLAFDLDEIETARVVDALRRERSGSAPAVFAVAV
jgi:excinuclease UvrABC nuclease subunit